MKTFLIISLIFGVGMISDKVNAQTEKGNIVLETYYGYTYEYSYFKALDYDISSKYSNFGPLSLRGEFLLSNRIGVGIDMNYRRFIFTGEYTDGTEIYSDRYKNVRIRLMARMNIHFLRSENIDFYSGIGIGYNIVSIDFSTTNPSSNPDFTYKPMAFRLSLGFRYFFDDNWGVGTEIGIGGGSLANIGICYKF